MSLHIVGKGHALHDPKAKGVNKAWLLEGQTLDLGDPWVVEEIRGQEYKLEPAPEGASETPKEAWPGALLNRWRASRPNIEHVAEVLEAITPEPPAEEAASVETKRRGRRKKSEDEL